MVRTTNFILTLGRAENKYKKQSKLMVAQRLNELKSNAYVNIHASEINMRVYILIHIFIRFIIKIHLFIYNQTNFKAYFKKIKLRSALPLFFLLLINYCFNKKKQRI